MTNPDLVATEVKPKASCLLGLTRSELCDVLSELGVPEHQRSMRVRQLWKWIYTRGETDFSQMSDLGKDLRKTITNSHSLARPAIATDQISADGTRKWLLHLSDGKEIEMVYIPDLENSGPDYGALCISSQVGCTLNCRFCYTGTMPIVRNLTPEEIIGQFMLARDCLADWNNQDGRRKISTIVMMGMGEPLLNFDNVSKALKIIMDSDGIALSRRSITLSTAGLVPAMERCGQELRVNLAVSLHAVRDDLRDLLVPLNRRYPIADLIQACHNYPSANNARRITFEYVMLQDINDTIKDAYGLADLLAGLPAKINLIPFNPWPGAPYKCSSKNRINRFARILNEAGFAAPIRTPRGQDIMAACGQLKSPS